MIDVRATSIFWMDECDILSQKYDADVESIFLSVVSKMSFIAKISFINVRFQDIIPVQKPAIQLPVWRKSVVQQKLILGSTDCHPG